MTTEIKLRADQRAAGACLYATSPLKVTPHSYSVTASPDVGAVPCNSSTAHIIRRHTA